MVSSDVTGFFCSSVQRFKSAPGPYYLRPRVSFRVLGCRALWFLGFVEGSQPLRFPPLPRPRVSLIRALSSSGPRSLLPAPPREPHPCPVQQRPPVLQQRAHAGVAEAQGGGAARPDVLVQGDQVGQRVGQGARTGQGRRGGARGACGVWRRGFWGHGVLLCRKTMGGRVRCRRGQWCI